MSGHETSLRVKKRTMEMEKIFQDNREAIIADLNNLELTVHAMAVKWKVSDRIMRRFGERLKFDMNQRQLDRRAVYSITPPENKREKWKPDDSPQAHKVWALWG